MSESAPVRFLRTCSFSSVIVLAVFLAAGTCARAQSESDWTAYKAHCGIPQNLDYETWVHSDPPIGCPAEHQQQQPQQQNPSGGADIPSGGDPLTAAASMLGSAIGNALFNWLFGPSQPQVDQKALMAHSLNGSGIAAFNQQHYAEAAKYFQQALELKPDDAVIQQNLTNALKGVDAQTRQSILQSLNLLEKPATNGAPGAAGSQSAAGSQGTAGSQSGAGASQSVVPTVKGLDFAAPPSGKNDASSLQFGATSGSGNGSGSKAMTFGSAMDQAQHAAAIDPNKPTNCPFDTAGGGADECPGKKAPVPVDTPSFRFAPASQETPQLKQLHQQIDTQRVQVQQLNTQLDQATDPVQRAEIKQQLSTTSYTEHLTETQYTQTRAFSIPEKGNSGSGDSGGSGNGASSGGPGSSGGSGSTPPARHL